jgi:TetR/AcrR family transcriptional repressor of bet genes
MTPRVGVAPLRREQIVRATIHCLAHAGYAGLTMKGVAREAGLSQGILHYYFKDKRAILAAAALRVSADLDRRVAAEARGARGARARLRALVRACLEVAARDREFWTVFIELWGESLHDRTLAVVNARAYARSRRLIAAGIRKGVREGRLRRLAPDGAAAVVLAVLDGLALQHTFDRRALPRARAQKLCEDVLWTYLRRRGERR